MVNIEYANAYSEVLEILKYVSEEGYNKIPKYKIEFYKLNANPNHIFKYDLTKTLDEQNVSLITKGIIAIIFRDYWTTDEQRTKILEKQKQIKIILEKQKKVKYNTDNIFESNKDNIIEKNMPVKKETLYKRIINFFKKKIK